MRLRSFLFFSLSLLIYHLDAQTIISGIVTDSSNLPIPFASVYLSKTTIGTTTSNEGNYTLTIPQDGEYELIASCIGYNASSKVLFAGGKKQTINIKLSQNLVQLEEITVSTKAKKRVKNYNVFTRLLLGETENSQTCTIRNIEDLFLFEDQLTGIIKGRSHKPIQIENKSLGYLVVYDFSDVTFNPAIGLLQFTGGLYFQQLPGNDRNIQKWTHNRLTTYYGSRMHFLRALFSDSLNQESYKISDCKLVQVKSKSGALFQNFTPLETNSARIVRYPDRTTFFSSKPLLISYFNNHPELASEVIGYEPKKYESTIEFSDSLTVFRNGYFKHPFAATWGGQMGNERIADLLPFDFVPGQVPPTKTETLEASLANPLTSLQKATGRDQVFVQLDRNIYRPGDTIFFQSFIRNRISGTFESNSVALYTLLFNPKKLMADSSRFKIRNSTASGWIPIPVKAEPGRYRFAAFTGMMQNYDPAEAFQLDIEVIDPSKNQDINLITKETDRNIARDTSRRVGDSYFELRFLPESGNYIEGIRQRVGFNATNGKGEPIYVEGLLKNSSGTTLDTIKSGEYGPGAFFCTARPGLFVEITRGAGSKKIWPLPVPKTKGITMSVSPVEERAFLVDVQSDYYASEPATVVVYMDLTQVFSREITLNKRHQLVIEAKHLPSGIADIVLLDKNMQPIAERLYYLNADKHLKYTIVATDKRPGADKTLSISLTDGQGNPVEGIFSIAVTDSAKGINPFLFAPGIEYTLNYLPFLMGNLPGKALLKGLENMTDDERNLLLMVFGWTKYSNAGEETAGQEKQLLNFDLMSIRLLNVSKNQRANKKLDLYSLEDLTLKHLLTNPSGEAFLPLDSLSELTRSVTVMPDLKSKNRIPEAMLSIPYDHQYFRSSRLFRSLPSIPLPRPLAEEPVVEPVPKPQENYSLGEKNIEIPEVVIIGRPASKKEFHDKYEQQFQNSNIRSLDIEPLQSSYSLEIALRKLISPYNITNDDIILRPPRSIFGLGGPVTALIVLDGLPLYQKGWAMVKDISPTEVTSLTILNGQQGFARYGDGAQGGVIYINTRSNNKEQIAGRTRWSSQNKNGNLLKPIEIYRKDVEYYCPSKPESGIDPMLQGRGTIFWKSDVYFDGKEPVKINYNHLGHTGVVSVIINGISGNHLSGTGKITY
ncbi:MAG: carboxypeptidase-like regulatory domain-containing protein [Prolixibacteraceae bacterium]